MAEELKILQKRTCGECVFCCRVLGVQELNKAPNVWCQHCDIGSGCKIYDSRPESCRAFSCTWLNNTNLPDEWRPDRSKVCIWEPEGAPGVVMVNVDPGRPYAWKEGTIGRFLELAAKKGLEIRILIGDQRTFLTYGWKL